MTETILAALLCLPWLLCAAGWAWWVLAHETWRWAR